MTQTDMLRPTIAPTQDGQGALVIFDNGSRGTIALDDLQAHIEDLRAMQAKLARSECLRIAGIDGGFQKVFGAGVSG